MLTLGLPPPSAAPRYYFLLLLLLLPQPGPCYLELYLSLGILVDKQQPLHRPEAVHRLQVRGQ